jgi:hypothetical protein
MPTSKKPRKKPCANPIERAARAAELHYWRGYKMSLMKRNGATSLDAPLSEDERARMGIMERSALATLRKGGCTDDAVMGTLINAMNDAACILNRIAQDDIENAHLVSDAQQAILDIWLRGEARHVWTAKACELDAIHNGLEVSEALAIHITLRDALESAKQLLATLKNPRFIPPRALAQPQKTEPNHAQI